MGCAHHKAGQPETYPLGTSKGTLTIACDDGATATATVGPNGAGTKLTFTGGVCWTENDGSFTVAIGASPAGARKPGQPKGFWLNDFPAKSIVKDSVSLGSGAVYYGYAVTISPTGARSSGTFKGTEGRYDPKTRKQTSVEVNGSWKCRHVRRVPA